MDYKSKIAHCDACSMEENGVKSRIALIHTCGKHDRNTTEQTKRNYSEQDLPDAKRKEVRPIPSKSIGNTAHEIRKGTKNNGKHES